MDCLMITMPRSTFLCLMFGLMHLSASQDIKDVCDHETFNATCPKNHVLLVTHALYGRMKKGRCIGEEGGYLGCSTSVLSTFDARCSGRMSCAVPVHEFLRMKECSQNYASYLEVAYKCIKMPVATQESCSQNNGVLIEGQDGFIMYSKESAGPSYSSSKYRTPGVEACPWNIKVKDGQKINLTVMIFGEQEGMKFCNDKLRITDGKDHRDLSLCGDEVRGSLGRGIKSKEKHIYTSQHSQVSAYIVHTYRVPRDTNPKYMLHYQAEGCANMTVQAPAWADRHDASTLMVKCNNTGEIWYLTCTGSTWVGDIGNCTKGTHTESGRKSQASLFHYGKIGIVFAILIGIALGATIGALLLLLVHCYKRKMKGNPHSNFVMVPQEAKEKFYEEGTYKPSTMDPKSGQLKDAYPALLRDSEPYETRAPAGVQTGGVHKQCFSVENHNMQIKSFPHDRTLYHSLDTKCRDCACPNSGNNRCELPPGSRYIDVE